jgi:predicted dehydrogenase
LTTSLATAKKITNIYKKYDIPLLVNYSRRFVPEFIKIKREIDNKKYGKLVTGIGYYGKGILHNGSHLTNLLRYYFGEIKIKRILNSEHDFFKDDPSVSAELTIGKANFILRHINCQLYTIFEIDLLFEKARIRILNSGFTVEKNLVEESHLFKGYKYLVKKEEYKTLLDNALYYTAEHIYKVLSHKAKLSSPANDALEDVKLCLDISKKSLR